MNMPSHTPPGAKPYADRIDYRKHDTYAELIVNGGPVLSVPKDSPFYPMLERLAASWNTCVRMSLDTLAIAGAFREDRSGPDAREWFDTWFTVQGDADAFVHELTRLRHCPPTGYVIELAGGGKWRTLDSIGMPDWTDKIEEALCVSLRAHADAYAADDPEDVRIVPVVGDRKPDSTLRYCLVPVHEKDGADWDSLHQGDLPPWPLENGYEWARVILVDAPSVHATTPESIEQAQREDCPNIKGNPRDGYYCDTCGSGPCTGVPA
jgi:hypothetical protein